MSSLNDLKAHEAQDTAMVADRLLQGDQPDLVRNVDHSAMFRSKPDAIGASRDLEDLGYKVDKVGRHWSHPRWVRIEFRCEQATDIVTVRRSTATLVELCGRHGGVYDGWGAFIEPGPDTGSST